MPQSLTELVPRLRRAVEGPVAVTGPAALTDDQLEAMAADAVSDIIFYSSGGFHHTISVTGRDDVTNAPDEWEVDPALTLPEETVVANQAALNYFFYEFKEAKVQEAISDEGQSWSYQLSANVLSQTLKNLRDDRDRALDVIAAGNDNYVGYASYIAERDAWTAQLIEPWVYGMAAGGGQFDYRFAP